MTNVIKKIYKNGTEYDIYATGGAEGAVSGPSSATDGHLAVFDGTTGKLIKDGGAVPTNKSAASGGTDTSLVTTGEKYTWNNKQDSLTTQTAYTSKGSATKVPQITTNTLGQVTAISEVTITQPDISGKANTSDVLTKTNTTSYTPTADYHPATKKYVDDNAGGSYTAGNGIDITNEEIGLDGMYNNNSDMQGPAPRGFHIPSITEWQGVETIMEGLSLTVGNKWRTNLHMPLAGKRNGSDDAAISYQGSNGFYWSSSPYSSSNYAYGLLLSSSEATANYHTYRSDGFPIRCFKNSYVEPDLTWTVIQGTLGSAGIFRNQSKGLISITDGTTGYTIIDKNLGATTVYNDGDTLSQANIGNMYQRGNNYGFPSTGSVTYSYARVDASAYGPGNYYSSSTFLTYPGAWDSSNNRNLWGAISGTVSGNLIIGDQLYKIVTSTTPPASSTPSNIITFVTD